MGVVPPPNVQNLKAPPPPTQGMQIQAASRMREGTIGRVPHFWNIGMGFFESSSLLAVTSQRLRKLSRPRPRKLKDTPLRCVGASKPGSLRARKAKATGVIFGCLGRKIDVPGLPGGFIIYQGHLFPLKGHLWQRHIAVCWAIE